MKVIKFLDCHLELIFICFALSFISALMFAQIICRNIFSYAIPWAEEACRYVFVWCGSLGISYAVTKNSHLRMDVLPSLVPKLKKPLAVFSDITLLAVMLYLIKPGYETCVKLAENGQLSAAMRLPMVYVYLGLEITLFLTTARIIEKYIKLFVVMRNEKAGV